MEQWKDKIADKDTRIALSDSRATNNNIGCFCSKGPTTVEEFHAHFSAENRGGDAAFLVQELRLPKLPPIPEPTALSKKNRRGRDRSRSQRVVHMKGPYPNCNWIIPGRVLQGAYPSGKTEKEFRLMVSSIMRSGVSCFVVRFFGYAKISGGFVF